MKLGSKKNVGSQKTIGKHGLRATRRFLVCSATKKILGPKKMLDPKKSYVQKPTKNQQKNYMSKRQ